MSRLADGRYRCPRCEQVFAQHEMRSDMSYCRPCGAAKYREGYSQRMSQERAGIRPDRDRMSIPADFAKVQRGKSGSALADMYGVNDKTIWRWRIRLGLSTSRVRIPDDFAAEAAGMTYQQVSDRWGVHASTAFRWLRSLGAGPRKPGRPVTPLPADWADACLRMGAAALARRYKVSAKTITRWARVSGIEPSKAAPGAPRSRNAPAKRVALTLRRDPRPVPAPVVPVIADCPDCTPTRLCKACQAAQVQADIDAWLAAGNKPHEVPAGVSGRVAA